MPTAASILFEIAGRPEIAGAAPLDSPCAVCGAICGRGLEYERWQGANFTDQNKLHSPGSAHVCEACVWAHSWVQPPGMPRDPAPFERQTVRRICVAPTLEGCLLAVRGTYYRPAVWVVYRLDDSIEDMDPIGVPDAGETGERWLLEPGRFIRAGRVS